MDASLFDNIDSKLLAKFKSFHLENPGIYHQFRKMALQIRAKGHQKYSGWTIINVIRWEYDLKTVGDVFYINNDFIALYCRLIIYHDPSFYGFFELRKMKSCDRRSSDEERYRKQ